MTCWFKSKDAWHWSALGDDLTVLRNDETSFTISQKAGGGTESSLQK